MSQYGGEGSRDFQLLASDVCLLHLHVREETKGGGGKISYKENNSTEPQPPISYYSISTCNSKLRLPQRQQATHENLLILDSAGLNKEISNTAIQRYVFTWQVDYLHPASVDLKIHPVVQSTLSTIRIRERLYSLFVRWKESLHQEPVPIALALVNKAGQLVSDLGQLNIGKYLLSILSRTGKQIRCGHAMPNDISSLRKSSLTRYIIRVASCSMYSPIV